MDRDSANVQRIARFVIFTLDSELSEKKKKKWKILQWR